MSLCLFLLLPHLPWAGIDWPRWVGNPHHPQGTEFGSRTCGWVISS